MADLSFMRTHYGLVPADEQAAEWFAKVRMGQTVAASVRLPRNWRFHRKFFAMLNVAYANYDWPQIDTKWGAAQCSFDSFREYGHRAQHRRLRRNGGRRVQRLIPDVWRRCQRGSLQGRPVPTGCRGRRVGSARTYCRNGISCASGWVVAQGFPG